MGNNGPLSQQLLFAVISVVSFFGASPHGAAKHPAMSGLAQQQQQRAAAQRSSLFLQRDARAGARKLLSL